MKNISILLILLLNGLTSFGQQEIILTKYTYSSLFFNPAYAGSHGEGEGSGLIHYRNQWLGFEGAPITYMGAAEFSLADNRVGLGLNIAKEEIGVEDRLDIALNYAYRIELKRGQLAIGIKSGYSYFSDNFSSVIAKDPTDIFDQPSQKYSLFNVGGGLYFNTDEFYFGLAVPSAVVFARTHGSKGERSRHYYLHAGMIMGDQYSTVKFEPSLLVKYENAAPLQVTFGIIGWIKEKVGVGFHWRNEDALGVSAEFHFGKGFRIGTAYDFTISDLRKYSNNTVEILMGYSFNTSPKSRRVRNIRHGGRF